VDVGRLPVYLARSGGRLESLALPIAIAIAGVLVGTIAGEKILFRLSRDRFQQVISILILALGIWLVVKRGI